jgi:pyruvate dehydrogenase E2 component (dihydrolipoamide acetyltransferase)
MPEILMPRLSDTMEEGVVSSWHKKVGDEVAEGESLVDIETDKALMEYEADTTGVLESILVAEGETAGIGRPIAVIRAPGEAPTAPSAPAPDTPAPAPVALAVESEPGAAAAGNGSRPPSSPLARRIAREKGLDLAALTGSGPGGRIVRADVEAAAASGTPSAPAAVPTTPKPTIPVTADDEELPLSRIRQITARRLAESKREAPHIYLTRHVDVDELVAFRTSLNAKLTAAGRPKVSLNDLIVRACAVALRAHPAINASFADDHLVLHKRVHVGIAVALDDGLVVPVVKDTDRKAVSEISKETRDLAGRARDRKLAPDEMSGGTFTVSNLGMFGIDEFTAVINPPEVAILAVGATRQEVAIRDGNVVPALRMTVTLSVDHRAADGATGAKFLADVVALLEDPLRILA